MSQFNMTFPIWIQAIASFATVILSLVVLCQNKKIGTLKEITEALAKQTDQLRSQADTTIEIFKLSKYSLAMQMAPILVIKNSQWLGKENKYRAVFENNAATFLKVEDLKSRGLKVEPTTYDQEKLIDRGAFFKVTETIDVPVGAIGEFYVFFKSPSQNVYRQFFHVKKIAKNPVEGPPKCIYNFNFYHVEYIEDYIV